MSPERLGDAVPVPTEQHHAAQPLADPDDEVVEGGALGEAAGDPHDVLVAQQRRGRGVRVGGLGVVDVGDPVDDRDLGDPVAVGPERPQPVAHRHRRDAVRAGQRRGGQRVGHEVRGRGRQVGDRAELGGAVLPLLDERPVGEHVVDDARASRRRARRA